MDIFCIVIIFSAAEMIIFDYKSIKISELSFAAWYIILIYGIKPHTSKDGGLPIVCIKGGKHIKLFKNLFHVTLFVNDIGKSLEFYNKLGFELLFTMSETPGDKPWNHYLRIAHDQYLELQTTASAAPAPHPAPEKVRSNPDSSMWHYALQTENLENTIKCLIEQGITVWKDPEKNGIVTDISGVNHADDGCLVAWLIDPDGNPIEIMEQVGETLQRKYDYPD